MSADDFRRLVADALRSSHDASPAGQLLVAALGAGGVDGYDAFELLALWITETLDPGGTGPDVVEVEARGWQDTEPRVIFRQFQLHGLDAAALRLGL